MRLFGLALLILISSCTVYKSSDRDDFDANGKARAPQTLALTQDDRDLLASPCTAFNALSNEQFTSLFGPSARLSMVNEVSPKTATCLITPIATNGLSAPSHLACSWKPISGERIATVDEFSAQTTEEGLREDGYAARGAPRR